MIKRVLAVIVVGLWTAGCATSFTGSPTIENGRAGCEQKCRAGGMEVAGMVYMGEYSDACVCAVPGKVGANTQLLMGSAGAVTGAVAGVEMQRQANQRNSNSNTMNH